MSDTLDLAVASKRSTQQTYTSEEISDRLDEVGKLIDRTKTLYEQYFMGIQKVAPMQLHRDCERKIRELTQLNIRNTALRFRFATITQKFGSYNTYWRRIMRQIEQGKYIRDVARVGRKAQRQGKNVPDEILASMPKRMRDKILRDRAKLEKRADKKAAAAAADAAQVHSAAAPRSKPAPNTPHQIEDSLLGDFDLDSMFSSITNDAVAAVEKIENKSAAASADTLPSSSQRSAAPPPVPRAAREPRPRPTPARPTPAKPTPAKPKSRPRPRPAPAPAPRAAPPPGMNEKQTKDLYNRYVQARKLVGEPTDKLSYQKLVRTLNKQAPRIMKQHNAKGVDFNVVIKGDKVVLKAKPKK